MKIYVAGPYSNGNIDENLKNAIKVADKLFELGFYPFCPHLTHFWHLSYPRSWEDWMRYCIEWLKVCHAVLRLKGSSKGADIEHELAKKLKLPVFHKIEELVKYRDDLKGTRWH